MAVSDFRIGWIKSKVESGLFLEFQQAKLPPSLKAGEEGLVPMPPTITDPFTECLEREKGKNLELLNSFLNSVNQNALAIVFWAELVQEKTVVNINEESKVEDVAQDEKSQDIATNEVNNTSEEDADENIDDTVRMFNFILDRFVSNTDCKADND
jgi:dynein heavy chain